MKQALCLPKDFVAPQPGVFPFCIDHEQMHRLSLVPREQCETDESLLQLIPYIVVRNKAGAILCYERGSGGDESRLHAKLSIGIGGHIDCMPKDGEHLFALAYDEAERELREETGLTGGIAVNCLAIYDPADAVGRVHLGLLCEHIADAEPQLREADTVRGFRWMTLMELQRADHFERLEPWSKLVVEHLACQFSVSVGSALVYFAELVDLLTISSNTGVTGTATQEVAGVLRVLGANVRDGLARAAAFDCDGLHLAAYSLSGAVDEAAFTAGVLTQEDEPAGEGA